MPFANPSAVIRPIRPSGPSVPASRRYLVVVLEGASDEALPELGGRTPLALAKLPALDACATAGRVGQAVLSPVPTQRKQRHRLLPELALAHLLGVPAARVPGRGLLEAIGEGRLPPAGQAVARLEALCVADGRVQSIGVAEVSSAERKALCESVQAGLSRAGLRIVGEDGGSLGLVDEAGRDPIELETVEPWPLLGQRLKKQLPAGGELGDQLAEFVREASATLVKHEVNATRRELGQAPVTHLWPWGMDRLPGAGEGAGFDWPLYAGLGAELLTTEAWALGLAKYLSMAAGVLPTGPDAELAAAQAAIRRSPLTVLHLTKVAAASFGGSASDKDAALRQWDAELLGPLWSWMKSAFDQPRLLVTPSIGVHTGQGVYLPGPVPFVMAGYRVRSVVPRRMTEADAEQADLKIQRGEELLEYYLFSGTRH